MPVAPPVSVAPLPDAPPSAVEWLTGFSPASDRDPEEQQGPTNENDDRRGERCMPAMPATPSTDHQNASAMLRGAARRAACMLPRRKAHRASKANEPLGSKGRGEIMKYRNLGAAGVKVSSLCLGAMTFGEADEKSFMHKVGSDEETAHAVLDRALDAGHQLHRHRRRLRPGRPVRARARQLDRGARQRRDKIVLATKFRFTMGDGPERQRRVALPDRAVLSRTACAGSRPIASTSTRSTCRTSTRPRRRRCARSTISCAPARSSTSAARTTPRIG